MRFPWVVVTIFVFAFASFGNIANAKVFECGTPKKQTSSFKVDYTNEGKMILFTKPQTGSETRKEMQFDFESVGFSAYHVGDVHIVFWKYGLMSLLVYDGFDYVSGAKCK